jgi:hypothetical protein
VKQILNIMTVAFACAAIAVIAAGAAAAGGRTYDVRDMQGEWTMVVSEIRYETVEGGATPVTSYCSSVGTVVADGMGNGTAEGTSRCIVPGMEPVTTTSTGSFTYTVSPDGTVYITMAGEMEPTHCLLADRGKSLLCDPMGRGSYILDWQAIAVKK